MTDSSSSNFDGLTSLIAFAGFTVPARARFAGQFIGQTLFTSLTFGLVAGQTSATLLSCGPLVPFMCGSWLGYTYGCLGFWKQSRSKALDYARRYPKVMAHGMSMFNCPVNTNPPKAATIESTASTTPTTTTLEENEEGRALEEWILAGGIGRISYAIFATQACEEDILEMQRRKRQQLVDGYADR